MEKENGAMERRSVSHLRAWIHKDERKQLRNSSKLGKNT